MADGLGAASVAFPLLGAGAFGWPLGRAAAQAATVARLRFRHVEEIRFVALGRGAADALSAALGVGRAPEAGASGLAYHPGAAAGDGR